ncbi:MAG: hypothetical protein ACO3VH_07180 [Ilumatobacteraceae bacterium]
MLEIVGLIAVAVMCGSPKVAIAFLPVLAMTALLSPWFWGWLLAVFTLTSRDE